MTAESASVRAIRARQAAEYEAGEMEGYDAHPNALPDFFYKPYVNFIARERGYLFGRELRRWQWERDNPVSEDGTSANG